MRGKDGRQQRGQERAAETNHKNEWCAQNQNLKFRVERRARRNISNLERVDDEPAGYADHHTQDERVPAEEGDAFMI